MKATVISYEPKGSDYVSFRVEGADSLSEAENFVKELDGMEDAMIPSVERNEDDSVTVHAKGSISSEKFAVGAAFGMTKEELKSLMSDAVNSEKEAFRANFFVNFDSEEFIRVNELEYVTEDEVQEAFEEFRENMPVPAVEMKRNPRYQYGGKTVALDSVDDVRAIFARNDENEIYALISNAGRYMLKITPSTIEGSYLLFGDSFEDAEATANRIEARDDGAGIQMYNLNQTRVEADSVEFETAY